MEVLTNIETNISERLKLIRGKKTLKEFSKECDVNINTLGNYERGTRTPDANFLFKIYKMGININWLLSGEGSMYNDTHMISEPESHYIATSNTENKDFALIPRYAVEASAGSGSAIDQEQEIGKMAFRRDWLKNKVLNIDNLVTINVKGDSMAPTITDGAIVLVDMNQTGIPGEGIYIIQNDDHLYAKRLQPDFNDGLIIKSDNPNYSDQHLKSKDIRNLKIIGKVVWAGNEL